MRGYRIANSSYLLGKALCFAGNEDKTVRRWLFGLFLILVVTGCQEVVDPPPCPPMDCPGFERLKLEIASTLEPVYFPGDSDTIEMAIELDDPARVIDNGVIFLAINERLGDGDYRNAPEIFADGNVAPNIFNKVFTARELRQGVSTTLSFTLADDAKPSGYAAVVQVFSGTDTNPNTVKVENLIGKRTFRFDIVGE
jgi:hypothetical protein